MSTPGATANANGRTQEKDIEGLVASSGYEYSGVPNLFQERHQIEGRRYQRQVCVGPTIYGHPWNVDLFLVNRSVFPKGLIIESKWQQEPGSVDEKFPYLMLNIEKHDIPTVIVADGSGYKSGAIEWLRNQTGGLLVAVYNWGELRAESNRGFFGTPHQGVPTGTLQFQGQLS